MDTPPVIYSGPRNASFKNMLTNILKQSKLKQKYISELTDEKVYKYTTKLSLLLPLTQSKTTKFMNKLEISPSTNSSFGMPTNASHNSNAP